jgi:hypothetical protein
MIHISVSRYKSALTPKTKRILSSFLASSKSYGVDQSLLLRLYRCLNKLEYPTKLCQPNTHPCAQARYFRCTVYHHAQGWVLNHAEMKHLPAHRETLSLHLMSTLNSLYEVKTCLYSCVPNQLSQIGEQSWPWLIASPERRRIWSPLTSLQAQFNLLLFHHLKHQIDMRSKNRW